MNAGHDYANTSIGNLIARTMLSTIALLSSSRRLGNTGQLIDRIAAELDIEVVDLGNQRISPYDYDHLNRHDDFEPLMKRVLAHDQIIFATPIYWYAVSPGMKVFLDRISDLLELPSTALGSMLKRRFPCGGGRLRFWSSVCRSC